MQSWTIDYSSVGFLKIELKCECEFAPLLRHRFKGDVATVLSSYSLANDETKAYSFWIEAMMVFKVAKEIE